MTLVETVVVIAITVILAGVLLTSYANIITRNVEADARRIVSDLGWVRQLAVSTHTDYCIRFNANDYQIYTNTCGVSANLMKRQNLDVPIINPGTPFDLTYSSPRGTASSSASVSNVLTITLTRDNRTKNVLVFENTGYVKMQ